MKRFIVRDNSIPAFGVGSEVVSVSGQVPRGLVTIRPADDICPTVEAAWSALLPLHEYLRKQPSRDYWCLERNATAEVPQQWLMDARTETYGDSKFRFESLGELVYWLRERNKSSLQYSVGHFQYLPYLVTQHNNMHKTCT